MEKLIEMIADGRLSLILVPLVLLVVWELWPWWVARRRERARRVYLAKRYGKSAKYFR